MNFNNKGENIMYKKLKELQELEAKSDKQAELMGELEARLGLIENKQI